MALETAEALSDSSTDTETVLPVLAPEDNAAQTDFGAQVIIFEITSWTCGIHEAVKLGNKLIEYVKTYL